MHVQRAVIQRRVQSGAAAWSRTLAPISSVCTREPSLCEVLHELLEPMLCRRDPGTDQIRARDLQGPAYQVEGKGNTTRCGGEKSGRKMRAVYENAL